MPAKPTEYQKTLDYLYSQLPMFQREGGVAMKKDLRNISELCKYLGYPHTGYPSIHVAGTNGKGSVCHILASVLQQKGLKVGLYTSPHYKDFRERVKINGELVTEEFVIDFVEGNKSLFEKVQPSFFEITVALAFKYFAEQEVDIAVIETGLGGRLDSTNIISPIMSIITNISKDHAQFLGETLPEIAGEKAGIIKTDIPVVIGERHPETDPVFLERAEDQGASIIFAEDEYTVLPTIRALTHSIFNVYKDKRLHTRDLESDIAGHYQGKNVGTVMASIDILNRLGYSISESEFMNALASVKKSTRFMGRWQVLGLNPTVLADSGHNIGAFQRTLSRIPKTGGKLRMVIGFVNDKDISDILSLFPKDAEYYFTQANIPRALPVEDLEKLAGEFGLKGKSYGRVKDALGAAKGDSSRKDFVFVGGSTFVVAEVV